MKKKTTYKKLILKIILTTLALTLTVAFIYSNYMKQEAIQKLSKIDARKTTELIFQSLYSAMEKGWTRTDLENIIKRLNTVDENMIVNVYRSQEVVKNFGDIQKDYYARENNPFVKKSLQNDEILNIVDDSTIEYYYPIVAKNECLKCHTKTTQGEVLGIININYPINDLKVSLSSFINFFILFIILFSIAIFVALYFEFEKYVIKPIKKFVNNINYISENKDIKRRIGIENKIHEIDNMQDVFNEMLNSLEYQFYYDELTQLPNRKKLIEVLANKRNSIIMIINIDKFQHINDLYGDKIGNDILVNTAKIINNNVSEEIELFKLHADEYALYMPLTITKEEIHILANHLTTAIEDNTLKVKDSEVFVNATIGVSVGNEYLLNNADMALKLAKKKKTKYLIYDVSMNIEHEYEQNLKWSKKIKDAIQTNQVIPVFQPIVDIKTSQIVKYEALMRIIDDNGDFIEPVHFLDLAKKNKLYTKLTQVIVEKTFEIFKDKDYQVSINLSVQDILNEEVHQLILSLLNKYKFKDKIVFELIESEGIENFDEVINFIEQVKKLGAKISIDDFGTGYSNFEYIMKLKVDYIKIDASMIKNIDTNKNSQMVTETIIDFAKKLEIKTIAEFIHSKNVYDVVKEMGVDYAQGYYLGKTQRLD